MNTLYRAPDNEPDNNFVLPSRLHNLIELVGWLLEAADITEEHDLLPVAIPLLTPEYQPLVALLEINGIIRRNPIGWEFDELAAMQMLDRFCDSEWLEEVE